MADILKITGSADDGEDICRLLEAQTGKPVVLRRLTKYEPDLLPMLVARLKYSHEPEGSPSVDVLGRAIFTTMPRRIAYREGVVAACIANIEAALLRSSGKSTMVIAAVSTDTDFNAGVAAAMQLATAIEEMSSQMFLRWLPDLSTEEAYQRIASIYAACALNAKAALDLLPEDCNEEDEATQRQAELASVVDLVAALAAADEEVQELVATTEEQQAEKDRISGTARKLKERVREAIDAAKENLS